MSAILLHICSIYNHCTDSGTCRRCCCWCICFYTCVSNRQENSNKKKYVTTASIPNQKFEIFKEYFGIWKIFQNTSMLTAFWKLHCLFSMLLCNCPQDVGVRICPLLSSMVVKMIFFNWKVKRDICRVQISSHIKKK